VSCFKISNIIETCGMIANPHKQQIPPLRCAPVGMTNLFRDCIHLSAQIDESDFGDWLAEETGTETLEFFDGVGGVEEAGERALSFEL
jgi:hypothetical protein